MSVEIGPEWDPAAHDYGNGGFLPETGPGREMAAIMGLTALSAFAMVGVGAFFTHAAIAVGEATTITYTVGGAAVYAGGSTLTSGQAAILATIASGGLDGEVVAVSAILSSWGMQMFTLDSLLALAAFDVSSNHSFRTHFGNSGSWMGNYVSGGGGYANPPGFPGFPGVGYPAAAGALVCYYIGHDRYCFWSYH